MKLNPIKQAVETGISILLYIQISFWFFHRMLIKYFDPKIICGLNLWKQHMENAYPGSNILVVTLTNGESKRVESQSDQETMREAMEVLRNMFGPDIPEASDILVPRWWNNRFQRGSYSNYPIYADSTMFENIKVNMHPPYYSFYIPTLVSYSHDMTHDTWHNRTKQNRWEWTSVWHD